MRRGADQKTARNRLAIDGGGRSGRLRYLPGLVLLILAGLPLLVLILAPARFSGWQRVETGTESAALRADIARLRQRVDRLETRLARVRANPVLGLENHLSVVSDGDGVATLRFSGLDLQVINAEGMVLDTTERSSPGHTGR